MLADVRRHQPPRAHKHAVFGKQAARRDALRKAHRHAEEKAAADPPQSGGQHVQALGLCVPHKDGHDAFLAPAGRRFRRCLKLNGQAGQSDRSCHLSIILKVKII